MGSKNEDAIKAIREKLKEKYNVVPSGCKFFTE